MLLMILAPMAAEARCPFLPPTGEPFRADLLGGRLEGATVRSGADLVAAGDPHAVQPLELWKQVVQWDEAALVVEEPLVLAPDDLGEAVRAASVARFGDDFTAAALPVPLAPTAPGVRGAAVAGAYEPDKWGASAALVWPDGSVVRVAVVLLGGLAADAACREAALARIAAAGPGPRERDVGGCRAEIPLAAGPRLAVDVPPGFAIRVEAGVEFTLVTLLRWNLSGTPPEAIEYVRTLVTFEEPSAPRGEKLARARILGDRATWTPEPNEPRAEEAWVRGVVGKERAGFVRVLVMADTPERRAELRASAATASFERGEPEE